jgi:hypothetical protein
MKPRALNNYRSGGRQIHHKEQEACPSSVRCFGNPAIPGICVGKFTQDYPQPMTKGKKP